MTRKSTLASLVVAVGLSLSLAACKDTKTLQENEQLKAQVADGFRNRTASWETITQTVTAARDDLERENEALKAEMKASKPKKSQKKASSRKRRRA